MAHDGLLMRAGSWQVGPPNDVKALLGCCDQRAGRPGAQGECRGPNYPLPATPFPLLQAQGEAMLLKTTSDVLVQVAGLHGAGEGACA